MAVVVIAVLTVHNLAGNLVAPARYYVPGNLATAAVVLGLARLAGAGGEELGLSPAALPVGLAVGLAGAGVVLAALTLAAAVRRTRPLLADGRMAGVGARGTAYRALVRIPLGTVVLEEVAFRGALPALAGPAVACALFGLWHVVPTMAALDANGMARSPLAVGGAVLFTAAAGWVLYGLAAATGSLVAPALVHLAANSGATVAAYRVLRGPERKGYDVNCG
ncbi:MAG: CPBP family intramembrane metalloprotease [Actinobacteria bacterium]|nr:CPBP family intramembrane metalloprotease [Actinomycetota bacterium]